jgi:hypothetical protein
LLGLEKLSSLKTLATEEQLSDANIDFDDIPEERVSASVFMIQTK